MSGHVVLRNGLKNNWEVKVKTTVTGADMEKCCSLPTGQEDPDKSGLRLFVAGATASLLSLVSYATAANDDDSGTVPY